MQLNLKYAAEVSQIPSCPPASVGQVSARIYRFFHPDPANTKNYLPPAKINPKRKWKDDEEHCDGFGLSMFFSPAKAEAYFNELQGSQKNIRKLIGSHLATAEIVDDDGYVTPEDVTGHFSLFESEGCRLEGRFELLRELPQ